MHICKGGDGNEGGDGNLSQPLEQVSSCVILSQQSKKIHDQISQIYETFYGVEQEGEITEVFLSLSGF